MGRLSAAKRGYDKAHWRWRHAVFQRFPNCCMCGAPGTPSDHADHVKPISQGGARLDVNNGQRLCHTCHNSTKQSYDKTGHLRGCDEAGVPLDPKLRGRWVGAGGVEKSDSNGISLTTAALVGHYQPLRIISKFGIAFFSGHPQRRDRSAPGAPAIQSQRECLEKRHPYEAFGNSDSNRLSASAGSAPRAKCTSPGCSIMVAKSAARGTGLRASPFGVSV